MIRLSIITICYNASSVIIPTLQSVASQNYKEIEYIVIDGASTDRTIRLVETYCPFAHILSEPDKGIYDAMNKGLQLATGDYVWFLNAGDAFRTPTTVQQVVNRILSAETLPEVVYGDTMIVDSNYNDLGTRRLRPPHNLKKQDFLKGMLVCHQAFIVQRKVAPLYDLRYKLSSDYDWCLKILEKSTLIIELQEVLVNYLQGGLSEKKHWQSLAERFCIMRQHFGLFPTLFAHLSFFFLHRR